MKKQNLFTLGGCIVLGGILISGNSFADNGHYVVRLKGNILYPEHIQKTANNHERVTENSHAVVKQVTKKSVVKHAVQPKVASQKTQSDNSRKLFVNTAVKQAVQPKVAPQKLQESNIRELFANTVVKQAVQPKVAPQKLQESNSRGLSVNTVVKQAIQPEVVAQKIPNSNSRELYANTKASSRNYEQRQASIHSCIFGILPGTYLDSMRIVNHLLNDSIRDGLYANGTGNDAGYLKHCLDKSVRDSVILSRLNVLLTAEDQEKFGSGGVLVAHCKDVSTSFAVDSVEMDVFSGGTLVASGISGSDGTIEAKNVPVGNYYAIFSRKAYSTFSLMHVRVTAAGQSYIDIPLNKQEGYLSPAVAKNGWFFIITWGIIVLLSMIILAYRLAKYTARRDAVKQFKVESPVM